MDILAWKQTPEGVTFRSIKEDLSIQELAKQDISICISANDCALKKFINEMLDEQEPYICAGRDAISKDICNACPFYAFDFYVFD